MRNSFAKIQKYKLLIFFTIFSYSIIANAQVSGTVFRDFNANGIKSTTSNTSLEPGVIGVTVTAYPASGAVQTTTTNATGDYSFSGLTLPVRIEFTNLPTGNYSGPQGTGSATTVQFYSSATTTANLGINTPSHYSQAAPFLVTPKHVTGNPFASGTNMATNAALYRFPNTASGNAQSGGTPIVTLGTQAQIGSTWGVAYDKARKKLFLASVYKRHAPLGPGETGGRIYFIDNPNGASPTTPAKFIDLVSDLSISVGSIQSNTARGLPANKFTATEDPTSFSQVGKVGLGDIDISDDGQFLFVVNLFDKKIYKIDIAQAISGTPNAVALPNYTLTCNNGTSRPWGMGMWGGELYLGVVCDALTGANSDLRLTVQKFNFTSNTWTEVLNVTPDWNKGDIISGGNKHKWQKWVDSWSNFISTSWPTHPQPIIGDIEFDEEGSMHLAVLDRIGFQAGHRQKKVPDDGSLYTGITGGELLRTYKNPTTGVFSLENNGACGPYNTGGTGNNSQTGQGGPNTLQGPGNGEFYCDDNTTTYHSETTSGGLSMIKGGRIIASVQMDPIDGQVDAQGVTWFNSTNGLESQEYQIFQNVGTPSPDFSKQNGLGDLEFLSDAAPVEIGNRVWNDTDADGIQDAGESGIDGLTVLLFEGSTQVASTTTANGGQYYFNNANVTGGLKTNTNYQIRIAISQTPLNGKTLTTTDVGANDLIDNDATLSGSNAVKSITTGNAGENNHSYDFGFKLAVCAINITSSISGCYQNNGSKATVSLEIAWENITVSPTTNDASDAITVTFAGQTKTINPGAYTSTGGSGTIVSPQVLAFEVNADASTQTAQAFLGATYAASTCKTQQTGIVLPAACNPTICANGQTGGTVWNDYNADGIKQVGESTGIPAVTVKAFDCNGNLLATTNTDIFGKYAFTGIVPSNYPIRVEFSNLPSYASQGTINGTDGRTTVQFVTAADCSVDLGVLDPSDFCQNYPKLYIPAFNSGDPLPNGSTSGTKEALLAFQYGTSGLKDPSKINVITTADKVGSLWGVAFSKYTQKLYATASLKRHSGLGPVGIGGLYTIDVTNNSVTSFDLSSIGVNVGTIASNSARGLSTDPNQPSADAQAFYAIGKEGLGDLDISNDGQFLYVVSLKDKKLNKLNISGTTPTLVGSYTIPNPNCIGGEWRPFGLKVYKGKVYVGGVCDAQSSDSKSNLRAYVYTFDENSASFNSSPIFDFPLTYPKGYPDANYQDKTGWYPWSDDFSRMVNVNIYNSSDLNLVYPQPIFTDIEFDIDGSMLLGFGDRAGLQSGIRNADLTGSTSPRWVNGVSGGDILRATFVGNTYILENAAKAGSSVGYAPTNNQGPGFGEFYNDDFFYSTAAVHTEGAFGGLALRPGSGEVITTSMDPIDYLNTSEDFNLYGNSGGIRYLNNSTGLRSAGFILYNSNIAYNTFGKATGLGDIEVGCSLPTYLEIGNRVWTDSNKNGVQDPCEKALKDVNVTLYKGSTKIASTKTDINGEYYFSTKSKLGTGWIGTGVDTTLLQNTAYKLVFGEGQLSGTKLTVTGLGQFDLTIKDATASNGNDQNDSDASYASGEFIVNLTTGVSGSVDHTFDVGFYCTNPNIGNKFTYSNATCIGTSEQNNGKVSLSSAVLPYDKYRVKIGTGAWSGDTTYTTALAIGNSFSKDLITSIPNIGATYVIRFYIGECCYKDTLITVNSVSCSCNLTASLAKSSDLNCAITSSTLSASPSTGATYVWSNGASPILGTNTATVTSSGTYSVTITETATNCTATATITVTSNITTPTANAGADVTVTCSTPSATLTATGGGTYAWSTGGNTASINVSPTTTTTYSVTVTASNGCTATDAVIVTADKTPPTANAGADVTVTCSTPSATLTATGGGTYAWSTGGNTASISVTPTTTTTYSVTVTASNGCTATDAVIVTADKTPPTANAGADVTVTCSTPSATLTATGGGTYAWSTGANTASTSVTPTTTTTYTVTVTAANGCTATDAVIVTADKTPPTANAGADVTVTCSTPSATLTATGGGTYAWSTGGNTASISVTPTTTTTYTVTVTAANGCTATDAVIVTADKTPPTANAGADVTVTCSTPSATLTATGGGTYAWSTGANTASTSVMPTTTTTYSVTVTASNGCTATDAVIVTADKIAPTFTASQTNVSCFGLGNGSITINASGGKSPYEYSINNGTSYQSSNIFNNLTPATYQIVVRGANGCVILCQ